MNLNALWEGLEAGPHRDSSALVKQSAFDGSHSAVAAGLRFPGAQRVLILRMDAPQARALLRRGLTPAITLLRLPPDGIYPGQISIELTSHGHQHQDLFALIGGDITDQLTNDPPDAGQVILDRLNLWREFLRRREDGDTERWTRGLFGELWYMLNHVLPRHPDRAGLACWLGPMGAAQDFTLGYCALDLKTGTVEGETVHISSLQQLTPPSGSELLLGHLRLRRDGGGLNLRELVASLRTVLSPETWPLLDSRLLAAGYIEGESVNRDDLRLTVHDFRLYRVASGFPALTPASVPAGIEQCTYTIRLSACHAFQVPVGYPWNPAPETTINHGH